MVGSFKHALDGIIIAFKEHVNFRIHIGIGLAVLFMAFIFGVSRIEIIILIFTINMVLIVEMINTAIEEITNLITIKWARQAKIAKDVVAGMAFLTALGSVIVGFAIFGPHFVALIF